MIKEQVRKIATGHVIKLVCLEPSKTFCTTEDTEGTEELTGYAILDVSLIKLT
jgi:hypothetical protein